MRCFNSDKSVTGVFHFSFNFFFFPSATFWSRDTIYTNIQQRFPYRVDNKCLFSSRDYCVSTFCQHTAHPSLHALRIKWIRQHNSPQEFCFVESWFGLKNKNISDRVKSISELQIDSVFCFFNEKCCKETLKVKTTRETQCVCHNSKQN